MDANDDAEDGSPVKEPVSDPKPVEPGPSGGGEPIAAQPVYRRKLYERVKRRWARRSGE
jgi:hypothetical protein